MSVFVRPSRRQFLTAMAGLALGCRSAPSSSSSAEPRIVSIAPSTTETVFALGAGGWLVGRSSLCDHPPEAAPLPVIGGYADPSLEAIVALRPTLVVGARGPAGPGLEEGLAAQSIETYFPQTESLAEIDTMLGELGKRLGKVEQAASLVDVIHGSVERVRARVADRPKPTVVWIFDFPAVVVAGPGGFPDELIRVCGGDNLVREGGAYPRLSAERLLALAPHVIIDGTGDGEANAIARKKGLLEQPGYRELAAVKAGRVVALRTSTALRPGPRIGLGVEEVASLLHPAPSAPP